MPHSSTIPSGHRPARIKDIARDLSLSTATVCRALNNSPGVRPVTRQRVLDTMSRLNYVKDSKAKSLRTGRHGCITAITPYLDNPIYALHANQARHIVKQQDYTLHFHWEKRVTQENILRILSEGTDGIILFGFQFEAIEHLKAATERGTPVLVLRWGNTPLPTHVRCSLDIDLQTGSQEAIEHLLSLGHRRIGLLGLSPNEHISTSHAARCRGITRAMQNAGASPDSLEYLPVQAIDYESSYQAMRQRIKSGQPLPTAIQASNDIRAVGALAALVDAGIRVPEDVSLIGFDNIELSRFVRPGLTTVSQSDLNIGGLAAEMMLKMIESPEQVYSKQLVTKLVIRDSTGPAPI